MIRPIKFLSGAACLGAVVIVAAASLTGRQAQADFCCAGPPDNDVTDYAVLYEGDPHTLFWTGSSTNSNIGISNGGNFTGSGSGTIGGQVRFAPLPPSATCPPCLVYSPGTINVIGGSVFGVAHVATDLVGLTTLSRTLAAISVPPMPPIDALTITAGATPPTITIEDKGSVDASKGLPVNGNFVFTGVIGTTNLDSEPIESNFTAGTTFTINGTADQFVVINIPNVPTIDGAPVGFDGSIMLTGGITSDHVLFNFGNGNFDTHTGGDPLLINTGGRVTMGTFLDPNGIFNIDNTILDGRIFGGDANDSFITGSTINAPPFFPTPEPTSLVLLGSGLVVLGIVRRRKRSQNRSEHHAGNSVAARNAVHFAAHRDLTRAPDLASARKTRASS